MTLSSVGRADLQSPASSPRSSPDPELTEFLRSRIKDEFIFTTPDENIEYLPENAAGSDEEAELMLFAGPTHTSESHKIRLSSPDNDGESGLLRKKPRNYYFADEVTSEKEAEYKAAAVTGDDVLNMAKVSWPGCALPWKVRTITPAGLKKTVFIRHPPALIEVEENAKKRTRKGKKSRIALRKKLQVVNVKNAEQAAKQAEQARLAQEKEETEREKRTRRNREKKVKRKARDKAKKEAALPDDPTPASPGPET